MTVADRLTRLMDQQHLSEYQLAKESGVPQPTIHRIKSGQTREPKRGTIAKLARALGVTSADLWPNSNHVRESPAPYGGAISGDDLSLLERIRALPADDKNRVGLIVDALEAAHSRPRGKDH